jgi:hypothetical protein
VFFSWCSLNSKSEPFKPEKGGSGHHTSLELM